MTYSPIQLDIIRTFGSKELSEGCYINYKFNPRLNKEGIYLGMVRFSSPLVCEAKSKNITWLISLAFNEKIEDSNHWEVIEILWHIPELFPDFARVADEKWLSYYINTDSDFIKVIIAIWEKYPYDEKIIPYKKLIPLLEQDEQLTLLPLLNLFK